MVIDAAADDDLLEVHRLLERHRLPIAGVDAHIQTMLVARDGERIVGTAALELYDDAALLRSVAVEPMQRGHGLGRQLTEAALRLAQRRGAATVFLLTTTAERYFPKFGFETVARDDVPASVQSSIEFQGACPASAIVMRNHLANG